MLCPLQPLHIHVHRASQRVQACGPGNSNSSLSRCGGGLPPNQITPLLHAQVERKGGGVAVYVLYLTVLTAMVKLSGEIHCCSLTR